MSQGTVFITDFDIGLQKTIGAQLISVAVDEGARQHPVIDFRNFQIRQNAAGDVLAYKDFGVDGPSDFDGKVPIFFITGGLAFVSKIRPAIIIRRTSMDPAPENGSQAWSIESRVPANGATPVSVTIQPTGEVVTGYNRYSIKPVAVPYNISYDIQIMARGHSAQQMANNMWRALSRIIEYPSFTLKIEDSEGDERGYSAMPQAPSSNVEVLDLTARDVGWTLTVLIHGEMDQIEPYDEVAVTQQPVVTLENI